MRPIELPQQTTGEMGSAVKPSKALRISLYAYSSFLFVLIVIQVGFTKRMTWADEDGLYNPIYMYQHYGKVTYPMQLQFDYMTVHPPTHYFIVGLLTKSGLQVFHAAAVPLVLLTLIAFTGILTSGFSDLAKFSVITGFTLATSAYTPLLPVRPDMHVTFCWFCGLVLLEAARSLGWENKRLFLGSFFVAYASGLHYWALACALMLPAYFIYILARPSGPRSWTKAAPIAAGALLFYIPYAIFFVVPHWHPILEMLRSANATGGGVRAAIRTQLAQLRDWTNPNWPVEIPALGRMISFPFVKLSIPPLLCAVPVLLLNKSLRGMALAGFILPAFVFTMISRKGGLHYISPELTLYSVALSLVFFFFLTWIWRKIRSTPPWAPYLAGALVSALVLARSGEAARSGMTSELDDWDVERAANQQIVGTNALIALNQCYDWYVSGATRIYWVVSHIGWDFMERVNGVRKFDSVLVQNDWFANNRHTIPFTQFYLDGNLSLRGFYIPGRYRYLSPPDFDTALSTLQLTTRNDLPKLGFGYDRFHKILNEYSESPDGAWILVVLKAYLKFPDEWPKDPIYLQRFEMEQPAENEPALYVLVTSREAWLRDRARYASLGTIRDEVRMNMREIRSQELLRTLGSQRIEFMTNQPDIR
jgi:hypothetical protein